MTDTAPSSAIVVTPDLMQHIMDDLDTRFADIKDRYPALVEACPYEMKLAVTAWAIRAIVEHAHDGGSFRHLIYQRLGFDVDAYVPLCDAGGLTISNEFVISAPSANDAALAQQLLDLMNQKNVTMVGGEEPWLSICNAAHRLNELSTALAAEQEKRARVEAELAALKERERIERAMNEDHAARPAQITFEQFSKFNRERCVSPLAFNHPLDAWSTSDWLTAVLGELGEAANAAKKLNRYHKQVGLRANKQTPEQLRAKFKQELGDTFLYLDLLAQSEGFFIIDAAVEAFDGKSREIGYGTVIELAGEMRDG